jgi:hypothetical protein
VGGGVRHLLEKYTEVQPLVFGHYGEINKTFSTLIERLGRAIAARHHRPFGWKNANAGISRARAGVMRRISMAILRATAQHLLSGLDIMAPPISPRASCSLRSYVCVCLCAVCVRLL